MNENRPVFIVGVGRSGTSLVQSMLAAHPLLAFPPETAFFRRFVLRGKLDRLARRGGTGAVVEFLEADQRFRRLGIPADQLVKPAHPGGTRTDVSVYVSMLRRYAEAAGKPRFGDKDPRLVEHLGPLSEVFADARVIHVVRDPRDVLLSKQRAAWSRDRPTLRHVFANRVQFEMGRRDGPRFFGDRYTELYYERLLDDPETVMRSLCDRLSLPYDPSMLRFEEAAASLVSTSEVAWKAETLGPLLPENTGKWRDGLSLRDTALVEAACGETMEAGAYDRSGAAGRLGLASCALVAAAAGILAAVDPVYRLMRRLRNRWART